MTIRKWWAWVVLVSTFAFLLQVSTKATAQDQPDQNRQDQNEPQNQQDQVQAQGQAGEDQGQSQDQSQDQGQDQSADQDPPGRVARLSDSRGSISFRPAGENDWVTGVPNRPLVTGDDLWADENSRAEANIGSTAIRLGPKTGITFLTIDDRTVQLRLAQGSMILRVQHVDDDDTYEVDTPNLAFTVLQPGEYRLDVNADGNQTVVTVWRGRGRATGGGFSHTVLGHQSATFRGTDHLDYELGQIPEEDTFDRWAFERDGREDHADSANYVSREMTGYEDLDEYGDWNYVAGYGPCWRPRVVAVGWAPYRFGHWVWVGPWGWTWVEDEPWGFAPFHYGRWAFVNSGWFWVPGPVVIRPVWAPALVAFVGGRGGFHFSAGIGVGWFPLAPGEVFVPGYRVSRGYVNNVNVTNTSVSVTRVTNVYNTVVINNNTNVNRITYTNQHVNGGVTVVSREAFVNARPVAQNVMRVEPREIEAAQVRHVVGAEPVRQSVLGAGRPAPVKPPATVINRQVLAQRTPPPPPRPLEQRQAQAGGRLNQQSLVRPEQSRAAQPNQPARPQEGQGGFRPFTQPSGATQSRTIEMQGTPPPPENRNSQAQPENRSARPEAGNSQTYRPQQREEGRAVPQETHPLVRPAPAVQERNPQQERDEEQKFRTWQQQRPAPAPQEKHESSRPAPRQERPSKPKGH
jgi:hypothetical protein